MFLHNLLLLMIISWNLLYQVRANSIAFVIDNTFSMKNSIEKVKNTITQITDIHSDFMFINNYVFVKFNDIEYLTKSKVYDNRYLFDVQLNFINGTEANLDCPEPALVAVMQALKRISDPKSHIYVFTDAPAKDYYRQRKVIKLCQESKSQITFVVTGQCMKDPNEFWMYNSIARSCSGDVLVISENELNLVPAYVRETIKGNPKVLKRTEVSAKQPIDMKFNITHKTDYVLISVSGRNVRILSRALSQAKVIWTDNFKAIKILYPGFGEHIVFISGDTISIAVNILAVNNDYSNLDDTTSKTTVETTEFTTLQLTESTSVDSMQLKSGKSIETEAIHQAFKSPVVEISEGYKVEVPLGGTSLLTCKVTGNPKPEIIWTDDNGIIIPSRTLTLYAPYLHISFLNVSDVNDNHFYGCQASNILGNDTKYIEIALKDRPMTVYDNSEDQYPEIDNRFLIDTTYRQYRENVGDLSTYTNTQDSSFLFIKEEKEAKTIDWCDNEKLYCSGDSGPYEKYEWLFNGNPVNQTEDNLEIINTGNYKCWAKNSDRTLEIDFMVVAKTCCIVNIGMKVSHYTPFVLNENLTFPEIRQMGNIIKIPSNEKLLLICHNPYPKTSPFYKNSVTVTCDHEKIFKVDDFQYAFEDMNCDSEVYPIIKSVLLRDEMKLLTEVGFISKTKFVKIYSVYTYTTKGNYHNSSTIAQYSPVKTTKDNFNELHWFDYPNIGKEVIPGVYNCHNDTSTCCYAKRQLVSANDVAYGAAQTSTFVNNVNSVPFWRTCDGSSEMAFDYFEQNIKSTYSINTTVWSGATNYIIRIGEGRVPTYLWKVIKIGDIDYLIYLYINVEDSSLHNVECTNNLYSIMIPDELKNRLYICNMTELSNITGVQLSTFQ